MGLEVKSVWQPYAVLDLDPDVRNTCVGRAPTNGDKPCQSQVRQRDRKLACNALNAMAKSPLTVTPQSLENLACLLLCKRDHQYQISEVVTKWTKLINNFQDQDMDIKRRVLQTNQLQSILEKAERQAKEERQESETVKQLLLELTQRDREAETLRRQLSKSRKAEEEALQATAEAERVSQDLSIQLRAWKRSATKAINRARELRSEKEILEDKLRSRKRDLVNAKKNDEKLTEELVLVRDQLGEMLYDPPPGEPWWASNYEQSFESTCNITAEVREAFRGMHSTVEIAHRQLSTKETDNSSLQQNVASAQAETEAIKKQLSTQELAYTNLQQQLACIHATLSSRNQQLALKEETVSKTQEELTSAHELARTTKQQLTSQIRVDLQIQIEASSTIAKLVEVVRVLHSRREQAERMIAADDKLFGALRLGTIRVVIFMAFVGALHMLSRL